MGTGPLPDPRDQPRPPSASPTRSATDFFTPDPQIVPKPAEVINSVTKPYFSFVYGKRNNAAEPLSAAVRISFNSIYFELLLTRPGRLFTNSLVDGDDSSLDRPRSLINVFDPKDIVLTSFGIFRPRLAK